MSCTFCHAGSSVVSITSSSGGEMPALLNAMSTDPYVSAAVSNRVVDGRLVRDVNGHKQSVEFVGGGLARRRVDVADDDRRALGVHAPAGGQTDAAGAAGDHGDLAGQSLGQIHQASPIAKKTFLVSVNDSGASGPSSRPSPDCLNPPNGVL